MIDVANLTLFEVIKQGNTLKRLSRYTDCTDGLPEELPYVRRTGEGDVYYFAETYRQSSRDFAKIGQSKTRRLFLGIILSLFMVGAAWFGQNYFALTLNNLAMDLGNESAELHSELELVNPAESLPSNTEPQEARPDKTKPIPSDIIFAQLRTTHRANFSPRICAPSDDQTRRVPQTMQN